MGGKRSDATILGRRRALIVGGATLLVGVGFAFCSWSLQYTHAWWSNLLANVAVVVLLLVPGERLLAGMRRRFERVEESVSRAEATATQAKQKADAATRSLDDIRQTLIDRQYSELNSDIDVYRNVLDSPTRDALLRALRKATQDQLISRTGVRVPVWETDVHYRFVVDTPNLGDLAVRLERDDQTVISETRWNPRTEADDFYQSLVLAVRNAGEDLGTGLNLPTQSVEALIDMLIEVTKLRSQKLAGHQNILQKITQWRDGWYFTERHIIPAEDRHYSIPVGRLGEIDWEEHLRGKGWLNAPDAIQFARRFYRGCQRSGSKTASAPVGPLTGEDA